MIGVLAVRNNLKVKKARQPVERVTVPAAMVINRESNFSVGSSNK